MREKFPSPSVFFNLAISVASPVSSISPFLLLVAVGIYTDTSVLAQVPQQAQKANRSIVFPPGAGSHVTRSRATLSGTAPNPAGFQKSSENNAQTEAALLPTAAAPTRGSFFANWNKVAGATGYRLDVSTSPSFHDCITGYQDLDAGNATGRLVSGLRPGTTYYYRVQPYDALGARGNSNVMSARTASGSGLVINATLDSSITNDPNSATIQSTINNAIAIYESLFSDPITVSILFRYSTAAPDGTPLDPDTIAQSGFVIYPIPWSTYITALEADAKTANDIAANASLPANPLSTNVLPSSAGGRAIGLDTPPAMFANGTVGAGGPYDGIVTLNSGQSFEFTRVPSSTTFDGLLATEHEIDEVLGLGSYLNRGGSDLRPQDLFSWSAPGTRNLTSSGSRYFSIDAGNTKIVDFNQDPTGDFGDWLSGSCPQANPYVQNAFVCEGQFSDVTETSPEGITLDVIGYDLVNPASTTYNPAIDPTVVEWLKADALSLPNGAPVATWIASKGVSLSAPPGVEPVFHSSSALNGLPIISTNGITQIMSGSLGAQVIPNQIFIVSKTTYFDFGTFFVLDLDPSGDPLNLESLFIYTSHYCGSGGTGLWDMGFADGSWQIICLEVNGDSSRWRINDGGWNKGTPVDGVNNATGYNGVVIGADHTRTKPSQTNYAEIIIRKGTANGVQTSAVINYLNSKWGVFATPTPTPGPTSTPTPTPVVIPTITVSASAPTVAEGGTGGFIVTRSAVSSQPLTVFYTVGGSAQLGTDYTLSGPAGQLVIPSAQASTIVTLHALNDAVTERSEKVKFSLSAGPGYKLLPRRGAQSATVTLPRHR